MNLSEIQDLLSYEKETGNLIWKKQRGSKAIEGSVAGRSETNGVKTMSLLGHVVPVRNIVWLLNRGLMPSGIIVHEDHDLNNTRIENLRDLSRSEARLHSIYRNEKPGIYQTSIGRFVLIIEKDGKPFFLGSFDDMEKAILIKKQYDLPERKFYGSKKEEFYVYGHYVPGERIPFYVGKGKNGRYRDFGPRNLKYKKIIDELNIRNQKPIAKRTRKLFTEKMALKLERGLILKIGFEHLTNLSIGGEGLEKFSYTKNEIEIIEELLK